MLALQAEDQRLDVVACHFGTEEALSTSRHPGKLAVNRGVRLVWTKCDMDVPDDQSFMVEGGEAPAITCPECLAAIG
jgi:hypothetical protein